MTAPLFLAIAVSGLALGLGTGIVAGGPGRVLLALGPAWLLGTGAIVVVSVPLLAAGVPLVASFVIGAAIATLAGIVLLIRSPWNATSHTYRINPPVAVAIGVLVVLALLGTLTAADQPLALWDAWSIYGRKAVDLSHESGLNVAFFTDPKLAFMHPDYPLGLPVIEALNMKFGAAIDGSGESVLPWLLFVAYGWTVVYVAIDVLESSWPILVPFALLLVPGGYQQALSGYADMPMAVFLGSGILFIGCWLRTGSGAHLLVAAILLAAAAGMKNEGLLAALVVMAGALAAGGGPLRARRSHALLAVVGILLAAAPWRIWIARHGIHGDVPLGHGLSPAYLADRGGRARLAVESLARHGFGSDWLLIMPAGLVAAAVSLLARSTRRIATFHLVAGLGFYLALVWVYAISENDIRWYLGTSAPRTVSALAFIAASAVVHLSVPASGRTCAGH